MTRSTTLLRLATAALRNLYAGIPHDEIATNTTPGLDRLLQELVQYLRQQGLDDQGTLDCDVTRQIPIANTHRLHSALLAELKDDGVTIGDCINAFAVPDDDPYVRAARDQYVDDNTEIDQHTATSNADNGAWVLGWLWVSNKEAGILAPADLLEQLLILARKALTGPHHLSPSTLKLRQDQADWLEDLLSNFSDEIDGIETEIPIGNPGPITWVNGQHERVSFMPSDALFQLLLLARQGGLPTPLAQQAETFCIRYGNKLDALLTVICTE